MVLWHCLLRAGYQALEVCHVNHCLRGTESDGDEVLVGEESDRRGNVFHSTRIDVGNLAAQSGESIELAARNARYAWFAELAEARHCSRVILAHHADDQVETVLMNLFRGTGNRGIGGMEPVSKRQGLNLYRPLLAIFREAIAQFALREEIAFREDESNTDEFSLRNRVRNRLIPEIRDVFQRDVRQAVLRAAEIARQDEEWISAEIERLAGIAAEPEMDVKRLREMPVPLRNRLIFQWFRNHGVGDCGYEEVCRVAEVLLSDARPAKANLPGNRYVRRKEGRLFLEEPEGEQKK